MKDMINKRLRLIVAICLISIVTLLPVACSPGASTGSGLVISGMNTSIGAPSSVAPNTQNYSYSITLKNNSGVTVYLQSIEPVLSKNVESKVLADYLRSVNKNVAPGGNIEVSGSFPFDATGLSKEDIAKLEPFITGVRVVSEETLPVPGQK